MNPLELAREVEARYRRYLRTMFYFKDPVLRASFEQSLASGPLSNGPYLEATPVFKRHATPRQVVPDLLGGQLEGAFLEAIQGDRPLYTHQEQAILGVHQGRNVVVATGTGSGKTEAFLYPILFHLYDQFRSGELGPGVRAMVLYPMNALANDQRDRLGEICRRLVEAGSSFRFTYGQYIGETPEDENDTRRDAADVLADREDKGFRYTQGRRVVHGELVLRSEMRSTPPHVLLTNYSMLEYLLLRPDDSPLFDNGRAQWWTFLVLDEAHQYRGSRGVEMAMLLRRLKQRLREGGRRKPFRCIATSATLAAKESDKHALAGFASNLFGEPFDDNDMILGEPEPVPSEGPTSLLREDYRLLATYLAEERGGQKEILGGLAAKLNAQIPGEADSSLVVGALLRSDRRSTQLRNMITAQPVSVVTVAAQVFPELVHEDREVALAELVDLLLMARDPLSSAPLLSARYHLFLRSLEGAFVSYWPEKRVFLDRKGTEDGCAAFEVALCRECGQHYLVGPKEFRRGNLARSEAIRDPSHHSFGASFFRPLEAAADGASDGNGDDGTERNIFHLCVQCGLLDKDTPACGHQQIIKLVREQAQEDEDRADQMVRCGACGYGAAGRDPVREVIHGTDGPHAVIASTLYEKLPPGRKKVLAFADGRQEAAFFAWYLDDSYGDLLSRNSILKALRRVDSASSGEGVSLRTLATALFQHHREFFLNQPSDDNPTIRANVWRALYREYLTDEQRISLEGVGLVRWSIRCPDWFSVPRCLLQTPWSLTEGEARDLMSLLFDTMRIERAVELRTPEDIPLTWLDLGLDASQTRLRIGCAGRPKGVKSWSVKSWDGVDQWNHIRNTRRIGLLEKLLGATVAQERARRLAADALREVWQASRTEDSIPAAQRLLIPVGDARRLNPDWSRLHLVSDSDVLFQCTTCGRLQAESIRGVCPRHGCQGRLQETSVATLPENHYRALYQQEMHGRPRVEEHTAQLNHEKAREFQKDFKEGRIHVLSCSTTFELGVDLGDLDTIFLRNVPPEAFNYSQRVGRAGRRTRPGFAITYCRPAPHDLYHFAHPERMMKGIVRPPALSLQNERIIARHMAAVVLSRFFRTFPERFKDPLDRRSHLRRFFKDMEAPSAAEDLRAFVLQHQGELLESLSAIVSAEPELLRRVGLDTGQWVENIVGGDSRISIAQDAVAADYRSVRTLRETAHLANDDKKHAWAGARARTIEDEDVLSFLSRKAVIPKYGFPVDVVELDTQRTHGQESSEISLQRDLSIAISEFAPTSKLIANKKLWTSYALKKVPEREWERWWYARCGAHNRFERLPYRKEEKAPPFDRCCDRMVTGQYVEPSFGFLTSWEKPQEPRTRPARPFTTRPYFAEFRNQPPAPTRYPDVSLTPVSPGLLVVLCEGRRSEGFFVCEQCGAGFRTRKTPHKTPLGTDCHGRQDRVSLGHEFVTDVLQLEFHPPYEGDIQPIWFAFSLAYGLLDGAAAVLEVPATDLNATVAYASSPSAIPPIILYDNVPGGAGLVARLQEPAVLRECLEAAEIRVSACTGCGEASSCYSCLRNYRNQFAHQSLQRGPVMHYLRMLLARWSGRGP